MFAKSLKINDTHRKKLCFTQFSTRMAASLGCLAASDVFFHVFSQTIKFYTFYITY